MISLTCQKYLTAAIFLYVCGQLLIKLDSKHSPLVITCVISFGMALMAFFILFRYLVSSQRDIRDSLLQQFTSDNLPLLALGAGFFVFLGNYCWIYAVKIGPSLGHIRMIMSGAEVALLLVASYALFNEKATSTNILGIALVLFGMYLIAQ